MRHAVADLGRPRTLADGYIAELGRPVPRWTTGAVAAGLAVLFIVYLGVAYAIGTVDTLEAMGGGTVTTYPFGAETIFTSTTDGISVQTQLSAAGTSFFLGVAAVTFTLGSRLWRAFG